MKIISTLLFSFTLILAGCDFSAGTGASGGDLKKVHFTGSAQGTYYAVTYYSPDGRVFQEEIDSILDAFDRSVSMWVPGSIISRVNRNDTTALPDAWFKDLFELSKTIGQETNGAFDMTIGPLVNAWGFGFDDRMKLDSEKIDSLLALVDYRQVSIVNGRVKKASPGVKFDFNAIAQGYSVDVLASFLQSKGIERYLVDIGGEIFARGTKPDGTKWKVAIEKPAGSADDPRVFQAYVNLVDRALATSGSYRKYYEENGIRYSHTIDPETGYPVKHSLLSVSVMAANCALADAYATAFMVMGLEKAKNFLSSNNDLEAYFIFSGSDGEYGIYFTEGFSDWLTGDQP